MTSRARSTWSSAAVLGTLMASASAHAQRDAAANVCLSTPVDGQKLRKAGALLEARRRFAVCARDTCPPEIALTCTRWASEVEASIPTVVLSARDEQGGDLPDAEVSIDGAAFVSIGPRAIELDPGNHRFVYRRAGKDDVIREAELREGEKNRAIAVVFSTAPTRQSAAPAVVRDARPAPASTWVFGAIGAAGIASWMIFGTLYVTELADEPCGPGCTLSQRRGVDLKGIVAGASLGVGILGLGLATWSYVARPTVRRIGSLSVDIRVTDGGGLAVVSRRF